MRPSDTTADAAARVRDWYRACGPDRRGELALEMSEEARELTRAGIRARHPDWPEAEIELELFRVSLGDELFHRAWPDARHRVPATE
jgi:hypothetical protein